MAPCWIMPWSLPVPPCPAAPPCWRDPVQQSETQSPMTLAPIRPLCQHLIHALWEAEPPAGVVSSLHKQGRKTCRKCRNALEA